MQYLPESIGYKSGNGKVSLKQHFRIAKLVLEIPDDIEKLINRIQCEFNLSQEEVIEYLSRLGIEKFSEQKILVPPLNFPKCSPEDVDKFVIVSSRKTWPQLLIQNMLCRPRRRALTFPRNYPCIPPQNEHRLSRSVRRCRKRILGAVMAMKHVALPTRIESEEVLEFHGRGKDWQRKIFEFPIPEEVVHYVSGGKSFEGIAEEVFRQLGLSLDEWNEVVWNEILCAIIQVERYRLWLFNKFENISLR